MYLVLFERHVSKFDNVLKDLRFACLQLHRHRCGEAQWQ